MSIIKIENLTFSYPTSFDTVFENANFQIDTDWKLGVVGRNGRGKTTLLQLLLGCYEYSGKILSSVPFLYFPYTVLDKSCQTETVLLEICPRAEGWKLLRELSYLEVCDEVLHRPFNTLSNGEQTKVLLAALFCSEGHFLLIDEPTNHLDLEARKIVAKYLNRKNGFILVSHDRRFLDVCADHILSLNKTEIVVQSGNFSSWEENFQRQQEFEQEQNRRLQKEIQHLQKAAKKTSAWSRQTEGAKYGNGPVDRGYIGHKASKMMKRSKSLEARQMKAIEKKSLLLKNVETTEPLKIQPLTFYTKRLVSYVDVSVQYNGRTVCGAVNFQVRQGERVVINGKNGSGKSSLLKLLLGQPISHTGTVSLASGLVISYVPQETAGLCGLLSEFAEKNGLNESLFKSILRKMDFERVQFEKEIRVFSEGQKKKVLIAKSLCEKAHLYVWDEPLNFIDIYSRIQIENLILEFQPTMLLIEHDQAFQDAVATKIVQI